MSQLLVHPFTVVDAIPLTRRIKEIMSEKGKYYTITAMAGRIGIHRETFRIMLNGEREIYSFELEKIAKDLKTTPERIKQEDYRKEANELKEILTNRQNPERALLLAEHLYTAALGCTERCIYLNYLGWALFSMQKFERAHEVWLEAYEIAEEISKKYGEKELLSRVIRNLMISYVEFKEYSSALRLSENIEITFEDIPIILAEFLYIQAKVKESQGDHEVARSLAYKSLEYAKKAANDEMIGRTYVNCSHYEYFSSNYKKSAELLELALTFLRDLRIKLIAEKELAKTLIKLGECERAITMIESTLKVAEAENILTIVGKLRILLARATGEIVHATTIAASEEFDHTIRNLACVYLMEYYKAQDDSINFMHYHGIAEKLKQTSFSDILDQKEL